MFDDRAEAGRRLAERLEHLRGADVIVVGLPRGGVPVAHEVARHLGAPLDVILVRKLGVPFQPELGMGAIGEDGVRVLNEEIVGRAAVRAPELAEVERREHSELDRRVRTYRAGRERIPLADRVVIVVDDGIATGSTAAAACQVARHEGARRIVLAVPVAPTDWVERLGGEADELICLDTPEPFYGVGRFYRDFSQTSDAEVIEHLDAAAAEVVDLRHKAAPDGNPGLLDQDVIVDLGEVQVGGRLTIPHRAIGVVIFAHGSGSSRHSPRNRYVASVLNAGGLATLLFDLLTPDEEYDRSNVFDIDLLSRRLIDVTGWLRRQPSMDGLPVGYFGSSTGAAAALRAATHHESDVAAVVSRGGRPDLAEAHLPHVVAPTLLIVGARDTTVLQLNRRAAEHLADCQIEVIPSATHLFEEPGTLERAAELAQLFFVRQFAAQRVDG